MSRFGIDAPEVYYYYYYFSNLNLMKYFSFCISLLLFFSCSNSEEKNQPPPNFLFILIDDLGWRDVGFNGSTFYETPNLDQLAREGATFSDAYAACPVCSPTRASIMTGKYPARLGITDWIPGQNISRRVRSVPNVQQMALEEVTIAEALKEAGYYTGFIGKWHLGSSEFYPAAQGFDENIAGNHKGHPWDGFFSPYNLENLEDGPDGEYLTERLSDEAVNFINRRHGADNPFFLYLSYYTVHAPYQPKEELLQKYGKKRQFLDLSGASSLHEQNDALTWITPKTSGLIKSGAYALREQNDALTRAFQDHAGYASMVESMDAGIGDVLAALRAQSFDKNTIVIFFSDNGGYSTEGVQPHPGVTSNAPLRLGKGWCYEGGVRVPLIVKWPAVTTPAHRISTPVISTDFYPTILDMAGLPLKEEQHKDGVSLVPLLKGQKEISRDAIFWHYPHYVGTGHRPSGAVRMGEWKLLQFYEDMNVELYNIKEDISESVDMSEKFPEKRHELLNRLNTWREQVGAHMPEVAEDN